MLSVVHRHHRRRQLNVGASFPWCETCGTRHGLLAPSAVLIHAKNPFTEGRHISHRSYKLVASGGIGFSSGDVILSRDKWSRWWWGWRITFPPTWCESWRFRSLEVRRTLGRRSWSGEELGKLHCSYPLKTTNRNLLGSSYNSIQTQIELNWVSLQLDRLQVESTPERYTTCSTPRTSSWVKH